MSTANSTATATATATAAANASATALAASSPSAPMRPPHHHPFPPPQSIPLRPPTLQPPPSPHPVGPVLYPIASSGRGFIPAAYAHRPLLAYHRPPHPHLDPAVHFPRPPHPHHHVAPTASPSTKGVSKVAPSPTSNAESNGYKHHRDRSGDDTVTVRDRKIRIVDGSSLYALCRSWLRNGSHQETQPQHGDAVKSLPRPLPMAVSDNSPKEEDEVDHKEEKLEDEKSVDDLSAEDLLKGHIKHAKKVRERLREERLKRIARYKTRLALLLPPLVEQFRNDTAAGN